MSGLVERVDLCVDWAPRVKPGWRGPWPCAGEALLRAGDRVFAVIECSCPCHRGELVHELPRLADRTAVHPTDVLAGG